MRIDGFDKGRIHAINRTRELVQSLRPIGINYTLAVIMTLPLFVLLSISYTIGMAFIYLKVTLFYVFRFLYTPFVTLYILLDLMWITIWFMGVAAKRLSEKP